MIILIGGRKGGCGKTTTAVNIAAYLASTGHDVVLVDADRQSTAATWAADRAEDPELVTVHCVQKYENIRDTLLDLAQRYQYVIVDTGAGDTRELRTGMLAADILIAPFKPSQPDLDTLPALHEIIINARDLNPDLKVYGLMTMAPTNPTIQEAQQAREYLQDYSEFGLMNTVIHERKIYRDSMSAGCGVVEAGNEKACEEIKSLMTELNHG